MERTWDLSVLYLGFDDPMYSEDMKTLESKIDEFAAYAEKTATAPHREVVKTYIELTEEMSYYIGKMMGYANLRYSANTRDNDAASAMGKLMALYSATAAPLAVFSNVIAGYQDLEEIIASDEKLEEHRYILTNIVRDSKYLLSDKEEAVFASMNISGASAWSDLQSSLTSSVTANYEGKEIPLSSVRNLAYDPNPEVRRKAYEAEIKCYEKIKEPVAFALNSIKLQVLNECRMRGYESPLAKSLYTSRMKKETLDALISAMEEYMPVFRKYLRAKAKALGHEGGLPWYDLFAPMGKSDKTYTVEDTREYLLGIFGKFDSELYDMVKCAFDERWIDFYPREGKVGGAFDLGLPSVKESRVLTNFDGSFSDIVTLAHELGHSFHDRQVSCHSVLNQEYSMPIAETASTFNEVIVMNTAIDLAKDDDERLSLIESQLMDACQIICDIYSRFVFEKSVFENRDAEFMSADRFCELMTEAQKKAYGDGLSENEMNPYMWLCKGHYYSGGLSYYNYPYAFGGLFARGLYSIYEKEGETFVSTYKKMLRATSITDIEDTAKIAGVDLSDREFWCAGLEGIAKRIDEFCELVKN